jgi:septal ring factor EnvC (AmiA/AmiB activator)
MKLSLLLLVVIASMGGIGYWYYTDTQERMAILQQNNAKLETAVALNEEALASVQADYAKAQAENQKLNQAYADIRRQNNRLSAKIANIDLGLLAAEKPDSMQRAVNRGTVNAGRCFELLSGAELNEKERNATSGEQFNKECPWLWDGIAPDGVSGDNSTPTN